MILSGLPVCEASFISFISNLSSSRLQSAVICLGTTLVPRERWLSPSPPSAPTPDTLTCKTGFRSRVCMTHTVMLQSFWIGSFIISSQSGSYVFSFPDLEHIKLEELTLHSLPNISHVLKGATVMSQSVTSLMWLCTLYCNPWKKLSPLLHSSVPHSCFKYLCVTENKVQVNIKFSEYDWGKCM